MNYTVQISQSGVAHVYFNGDIFCSVHHIHAGGVSQAIARAERIAELLNNIDVKTAELDKQ